MSCDSTSLQEELQSSPARDGQSQQRCAAVRSELHFIWDESILLMFEMLEPITSTFSEMPHEERLQHRCIKRNPLWWLGVIGMAAFMLPGHLFHTILGQGGPVRPDEHEEEKSARVGWVYTYSGGFVITAVMDSVILIKDLCEETGEEMRVAVTSSVLAVFMSLWYLVGDCNLLFRMRRRDTMLMHSAAISRITYGTAFLIVFFVGLCCESGMNAYRKFLHDHPDAHKPMNENDLPPPTTAISWGMRLFFCLFMAVAVLGYKPLLDLRYNEESTQPGMYKLKVVTGLGTLFTLVLSILFVFAHKSAKQAVGRPKGPARCIVSTVIMLFALFSIAFCMEKTWPTRKIIMAALIANFPYILVGTGFMICGPDLWELLAGG